MLPEEALTKIPDPNHGKAVKESKPAIIEQKSDDSSLPDWFPYFDSQK